MEPMTKDQLQVPTFFFLLHVSAICLLFSLESFKEPLGMVL